MTDEAINQKNKLERYEEELAQLKYAVSLSDLNGDIRAGATSLGTANSSSISTLFDSPENNAPQISRYMNAIYKKNGSINGAFRYYQSHVTYNHYIYPVMNSKSGYSSMGSSDEYSEVAEFIDKFNIKFYSPYFFKQTLLNGVSFFYKIQDTKGVSYMEFPIDYCRIYQMANGVYRWEIDMSKVSSGSILPNELAKAFEQYEDGQATDEKRWSEEKWYKVSDKGVAFSLDQSVLHHGVTMSEFSPLLEDSVQLENAKKNVEVRNMLDTVRLIHSEIPTDKSGTPLMTAKTARVYDTQIRRNLPKGVSSITSPMKTSVINLNGAGDSKAYDMVEDAQKQLFLSTGTHSSLFGGDTTSYNIVKMSAQKDANWIYTKLFPMLENYYNSELASFKSKSGLGWKMSFVAQSNYSLKDDIQIIEKQLSLGGSRTMYLASTGMTPVMISNLLRMEQEMMGIDSLMKPKQTSYTMSSSDDSDDVGRPTEESPTDDTSRINDSV